MTRLGDVEISNVEELRFDLPFAFLGVGPENVDGFLKWLEPPFINADGATFPVVVQSWIVRCDGLNIVVDPCHGNGRNRQLPHAHQLDTPYIERFEATGVSPEDIDMVFCTHLSCDHCGWNTRLRGGRWTPTFPNARYIFVRRELEASDPRRADVAPQNRGVFEDSVQPIIDAGLADLIDCPQDIAPGVRAEPAFGHTLGHAILWVNGSVGRICFSGDVFHHPLQIFAPQLGIQSGDVEPEAAASVRRSLARRIESERAIMFAGHFPAPNGGRIADAGEGFVFEPLGPG